MITIVVVEVAESWPVELLVQLEDGSRVWVATSEGMQVVSEGHVIGVKDISPDMKLLVSRDEFNSRLLYKASIVDG